MTVRTNLVTDPDATGALWTATPGTGGAAGKTVQSTGTPLGVTFARVAWTTATTAVSGGVKFANPTAVTPGTAYTASLYVRSSIAQRLTANLAWFNSSSTLLSTSTGAAVVVTAGAWTRISVTATAPAGAATAQLQAYSAVGTSGVNWTVGSTLDASNALLEVGSVLDTYFDGNTQPSAGWIVVWTGAANASTSTATIPSIVASLLTLPAPTSVQLVINDVPSGMTAMVTGVLGSSDWPVPGGLVTSTGVQIVLADNRSAINVAIRYQLQVGGNTYLSNPVTVAYAANYIVQSLDGQTKVPITWMKGDVPFEPNIDVTPYQVSGADRPPTWYSPGGDGGTSLKVKTTTAAGQALFALAKRGAPVVVRTNGAIADFPAVELLTIISAPGKLRGDGVGPNVVRIWDLGCLFSNDPEPSVPAVVFTWDTFDAVYASSTWSAFDTEWLASTWNAFDAYNWGQR